MNKSVKLYSLCVSVVFLLSNFSFGNPPDLTKGDTKPPLSSHDWNLGPTGLRGWMYSHKLETSEARQIYITKVDKGSPADGKLEIGDVILGVQGKNFSYDPRVEFGKAVTAVEAGNGQLKLMVWRKGKTFSVDLKLKVYGSYSSTAPFDCSKSKEIFEKGCAALAERIKSGKYRKNGITDSFNAIALLASGNKEYLPIIKEQVKQAADTILKNSGGLRTWYFGPVNCLIAEYTIATGDKSFLPHLEKISMKIVDGQSDVGSWGHAFVDENGRLRGYGMMNAPGLPLTYSLVLAREAGVKNSKIDEAITKSVNLVRFYVGKGSIPYGDHHPWIQTHEDNGKNGIAALLFNQLGDEKAAKYFSAMSIASHGAEREMGHTGNFFNMLYALPGVAISGPNATGAWLKEFGWYYDLARGWDGTFVHQGPPEERPDSYKMWDATGAYLLAYAQNLKSTHFNGKNSNLVKPVSLSEAQNFIESGRGWSPRLRSVEYQKYSESKLFEGLQSWSPVVRERSSEELARRKGDYTEKLRELLKSGNLYAQTGACQAVTKIGAKAGALVPDLTAKLDAKDLWLKIKAAEGLAAIGNEAKPVVPKILKMLSSPPTADDPRGMLQRYLCFALFNSRGGLLAKSLDGIDRNELMEAVKAGLMNEDGRARSAIASVYKNLSFEELKPLLPSIYKAIVEPAPSGIMFADGIQNAGLELLVKHKVSQGLELSANYVRSMKQHGSQKRIIKILKMIESYGTHAKRVVPQLEKHIQYFENEEKNFPKKLSKDKANEVRKTIEKINAATKTPKLQEISLK